MKQLLGLVATLKDINVVIFIYINMLNIPKYKIFVQNLPGQTLFETTNQKFSA